MSLFLQSGIATTPHQRAIADPNVRKMPIARRSAAFKTTKPATLSPSILAPRQARNSCPGQEPGTGQTRREPGLERLNFAGIPH